MEYDSGDCCGRGVHTGGHNFPNLLVESLRRSSGRNWNGKPATRFSNAVIDRILVVMVLRHSNLLIPNTSLGGTLYL